MAYRRKQVLRSSTFVEDLRPPPDDPSPPSPTSSSSSSSLAAQAIRASAAHRDSSSLSSAYGDAAFSTSYSATAAAARRDFGRQRSASFAQGSNTYEYTSMKSLNESKYGFWGILARKAKSILEDDNVSHQCQEHGGSQSQKFDTSTAGQLHQSFHSPESYQRIENPAIQRGPDSIASSLHQIGGTIRKSLEEGLTKMENRTADIIQETRKLQIRRKTGDSNAQNQATDPLAPNSLSQIQTAQETQLKASRDVANAMAAKAKLLLRELKTIKADLAFAKERCTQLEGENKSLRESRTKGANHEDDDLIRLQLETLLAEKARLAHENSIYARENRFLREIVEYHQLTMQDVVCLDEGTDEETEDDYIASPHSPSHSPEPLSPAISSPTFPHKAHQTLPPSLNTMVVSPGACPEVAITAPSIGVSDFRPINAKALSRSPSPKPDGLRRQRSSTPA